MSDPKYDASKGKQTSSNVFNKANKVAQGVVKFVKNRKSIFAAMGVKNKMALIAVKGAAIPLTIVLGFCIVALLLATIFVSPSLLFTSVSDTRTVSEKIRGVLLEQFDGSGFDDQLKAYMESEYGCTSMYVNGGSGAGTNTYYYLTDYQGDNLTQITTRTLVNIGEGAEKTCYVDFNYKNLQMFTSTDSEDKGVTADDVVQAYAQAVNSVISLFNGEEGDIVEEGELGTISPASGDIYGYGISSESIDTFNMSGYYSPKDRYSYYSDESSLTDKQLDMFALPGYSQHSLGDTISIQWKGDNAPTTTVEDTVDENGNIVSAKGEEIPAACIANPGSDGQYKSAGFTDATCDSYNQWNAASTGNYVQDDDGKYYVKLGTQNYTLKCSNQNAAGVKACFEDEKIKKTIEIAVDYGFVLRYPYGKESETGFKGQYWTFTYVGKDLAKTLYNNGNWITLESYYGVSGSETYENDASNYDYSSEYSDGIAGGTGDAASLGVANKLHYVTSSDDIEVKNCGGIYLKEDACTAYKEFQSAVSSYSSEETTEEETDTSQYANDGVIDTEIQYFDYENTTKVDENYNEDTENGNEITDPKLTDEGQDYLDEGKDEEFSIPTDDDLVKQIKATDNIFSIEGDYSEWTETYSASNSAIAYKKKYHTSIEGCNYDEERRNGNTDDNPCQGEDQTSTGYELFEDVYKVDVPLKIDLRNYRKTDIENTIASAVDQYVDKDQGQCIFDDGTDNFSTLLQLVDEDEPSLNCSEKEITQLFWVYVAYYYNNNIAALGATNCDKTYYNQTTGIKYTNVCDDGTAFTDNDGEEASMYTRIINGTPTTKKRLSTVSVNSPEEIAAFGENYSVSYTSNQEAFLQLAQTIDDSLIAQGYSPYGVDGKGYPGVQCVDFAWWRARLSYPDVKIAAGDGKNVASALVNANQGKFELVTITDTSQMNESYAGSIISYGSSKYGHVLFLEKAEQQGGAWYIWISEGNFAPTGKSGLGTIQINRKYELESFMTSRHCDHKLTLAVPVA